MRVGYARDGSRVVVRACVRAGVPVWGQALGGVRAGLWGSTRALGLGEDSSAHARLPIDQVWFQTNNPASLPCDGPTTGYQAHVVPYTERWNSGLSKRYLTLRDAHAWSRTHEERHAMHTHTPTH